MAVQSRAIKIRPIVESDRAKYLEMVRGFYQTPSVLHPIPDEYINAGFDASLDGVYAKAFMFEVDGSVAGYGLISRTFSQEVGGEVCLIEELLVLDDFRRLGIASKFYEFLQCNVPAARYRLEVTETNESAIRLYEQWGLDSLGYLQMVKDRVAPEE